MIEQFSIARPFEGHLHVRQGNVIQAVTPFTAKHFGRAMIQPNTSPPIITTAQAIAYRREIEDAALPVNKDFHALIGLYLTKSLTPSEVKKAFTEPVATRLNLPRRGAEFVKYYPKGATTKSEHGVHDIFECRNVLEQMEKIGMPLCLHGEVTDDKFGDIDHLERERRFVDTTLRQLRKSFPGLKISLEHISTREAVWFVSDRSNNIVATVTPQHLMYTHQHLFEGGLRPHLYCMPILKMREDLEAIQKLVFTGDIFSGGSNVFAGSDSAPHVTDRKHSACCPAGVFSAPGLLERYATIWSNAGKLQTPEDVLRFANFMSVNGPTFYGFPPDPNTITLTKSEWSFEGDEGIAMLDGKKAFIPLGHPEIGDAVPFAWKVQE